MSMHGTTLPRWMGGMMAVALLGGCAAPQSDGSTPIAQQGSSVGCASWGFDEDQPGAVPKGWSIRETNPTQSLAMWKVIVDTTAPSAPHVLALTKSENWGGTFNLAIAEDSSFKDLDLTVRVKAVEGEEDQGGGPIWRCRDENNYYICRLNPLESNFRVYKVEGAKRRQLDSVKVESQAGQWYVIRVTMIGNQITCYLDGEKRLEAVDDTFTDVGMVGLWTKADAVTSFDHMEVRSLDEH
ncbi:MAG: family 16 glycoside hydrolase [Planctomycetota bacterium]